MKLSLLILSIIILISCSEEKPNETEDKTDYSNTIVGDWQYYVTWEYRGYENNELFFYEYKPFGVLKLRINNGVLSILNSSGKYVAFEKKILPPYLEYEIYESEVNNLDYFNFYEQRKPNFDISDSNRLHLIFKIDEMDYNKLNMSLNFINYANKPYGYSYWTQGYATKIANN